MSSNVIYAENTVAISPEVQNMSTEELVYSVLDSDIIISLLTTNTTVNDTYERLKYFNTNLTELDSRTDAASTIVEIFVDSHSDLTFIEKECLGLLLTQTSFYDNLTDNDMQKLSTLIPSQSAEIAQADSIAPASIVDDLLSALFPSNIVRTVADINISTVGGNAVTLYETDDELTTAQINSSKDYVLNNFPNVVLLDDPTAKYNCHSYAWYYSSTNNCYWLNDCTPYTYDTHISCSVSNAPSVNAICVYFGPDGAPVHSAIVKSINGSNITCISKWGSNGLYQHDVKDVPTGYTYDGTDPFCRYFTYTDSHTYSGTPTQYSSTKHSCKCAYCDDVTYVSHTFKYTTTPTKHTVTCSLCGYSFTGTHTYNNVTGACKVCGYVSDVGAINTAPPDVSTASYSHDCTDCS